MSVPGFSRPDDWTTFASKLGRGLTAAGLTVAFAAAADIALAGAGLSPRALIGSIGLGLGFGLAIGALWAGIAHLLARAPRFASWLVWPGLTFWAFAELALSLRAFANLGTRYNTLAVGTLVACGLGALATGLLLILVQPTRRGPPRLMRAPAWIRWVVSLGLVIGAIAFAYLDRSQFPGQYATFHTALRGLSLFCICIVVLLSGLVFSPRSRAVRNLALAFVALLVFLPFPLLHAPFQPALETMLSRPLAALPLRTVRLLTDFDGDGVSGVLGGGDCGPFDAEVNPQKREIPGNGRDDDCSGGQANPIVAAAHQS